MSAGKRKLAPGVAPAESTLSPDDDAPSSVDSPEDRVADTLFHDIVKRRRGDTVSPPEAATVIVEVVGTHTFKPVPMMPTSDMGVLNNLICREIVQPTQKDVGVSATVQGLEAAVQAMSEGRDLGPYKDLIQRIAANQTEKSEVVRAFLNQIDHENLAAMSTMRANSLRKIVSASARNDLSVGEALVVWRIVNEQMPALRKNLADEPAIDGVTATEKIDYQHQQVERTVKVRWDGTTPQGRELIRKKLWKAKRELMAAVEGADKEAPAPEPVTA